MDEYSAKPFKPDQLVQVIKKFDGRSLTKFRPQMHVDFTIEKCGL